MGEVASNQRGYVWTKERAKYAVLIRKHGLESALSDIDTDIRSIAHSEKWKKSETAMALARAKKEATEVATKLSKSGRMK